MKKTYKILSIILAILMVVSVFSITASAIVTTGTCGTNATWTYNELTKTLFISGTGQTTKFNAGGSRPWGHLVTEVETIIIEYGITKIGNYSFHGFTNLKSVSIPESVTSIGTHVFEGCKSLTGIALPNGLSELSSYLFSGCSSLSQIVIPDKISSINYDVFTGCQALTNITIPDSVHYIYENAFKNCTGLEKVVIGKNIYRIQKNAFTGCTNLKDVYYLGSQEKWNSIIIEDNNAELTSANIFYDSISVDDGTGHIHNYKLTMTSPNCTEEGSAVYSCECGEEFVEVFASLGHVEEKIPQKLPTTTTTGCTAGVKCSRCGEILVEQQTIPALDENITDTGIEGNLYWTFDAFAGVFELYGSGPMNDYEKNENRKWNSFADEIKTVIIHEGVTSVGQRAFNSCKSLRNVQIPSTVTKIGAASFYGCYNLKNIRIAEGVTEIGVNAFAYCDSITSITIPEGVKTIDEYAFRGCTQLESITIPDSINSIERYAFWECTNLVNISLPDKPISLALNAFNSTAYYGDSSNMENGALYIGKHLIYTDDDIITGDYAIKDGTLSISAYAMYSCEKLRSVTIPDSVGIIGEYAFYQNDGLRSVTIGKGVKEIEDNAFTDCPLLTNITVDAENQYFMTDEYNVLYDKAQTTLIKISSRKPQESIVIPGTVTKFCDYAFIGDYYDDEFYYIKDIYFQGTKDQWVAIEKGEGNEIVSTVPIHLTFDGNDFSYSVISEEDKTIMITKCNIIGNISAVTIPSIIDGYTVTAIGEEAFAQKLLTSVSIPNTVTSIGYRAFYLNSLEKITIPDSVITIGDEAFMRNELTVIYMGKNVETIGDAAFNNSPYLRSVYYSGTENEWKAISINGDNSNLKGAIIHYKSVDGIEGETVYTGVCGENLTWSLGETSGKLVISGTGPMYDYEYDSVGGGTINSPWFEYKDLIKEIIIKDGVTTIGDNAFWSCEKLAGVTIPDSVTSIGISALSACSSLWSIEIPDSVTTIESGAFAHSGLVSIKLSNRLRTISEDLFYQCVYLEDVVIPDSVTKIESYAFGYCSSLKTIVIPYSVTTMGYAVFSECESLYKAVILAPITKIEQGTFGGCENLDEVVLPGTIKSAGYNAFGYCESLRDIYFGGTEEEFKNIVFYELWLPGLTNVIVHYNYTYSDYPFTGFKDNHFYKDDVMQKAYQLVTFGGDFYFIGDGHQIVKNKTVYLNEEKINGLTYADGTPIATGYYEFDANGKMIMREGIVGNNIYKDNTQLKAYQLVEIDGDFYFIGDRHEIVKNKRIYLNEVRINGLTYSDGTPIEPGYYNFNENGKMIILNGVVGNNIYKNNTQLKAYQLVEVDGDFYFIGDRHEIVKNQRIYLNEARINGLTYADGTPITAGYYNVDENGKLVILNGIIGNCIYKNNVQIKAYQLVEVDGDFYFIGDRHEIVKNQKIYLNEERINGLTYADGTPITVGYYNVDTDGKLIIE